MTLCYLGLGSNLNSPERQLRQAISALRQLPDTQLYKVASFYRSKAWGRKAQPHFCNTAVALKTTLTPQRLLSLCKKIEHQQGRIRKIRWGARTLDIDILLYGTVEVYSQTLQIPHPRLHERHFVFIPLLEIASQPIMIDGVELRTLVAERGYNLCSLEFKLQLD
ncbi:2-amino-4-hydroxy-6-hydroxymethyldihydropteridinepyrophosphokinase [Legionella massiliensis]|uniref:2-amino-4-hydroxy-6-hydroxymethyldihydropteridine pyrophosphokinase n=1 Tax=Legionella massiliensis TaxID=1034943 RepID=A0A078KZF1_9GAMM|nr:2-amino-4-hydroxy-6-hydroxymethyldihydropteridine diphosphokinase [Legionella massiliensis]CDZ78296.1 2-amino-4-hydroxy-6-hydroxymethyldihydropteridinepyrophosphokinase [Legionella massiliensis]CEE14034.1 2-amino-4-hydroxy-6-hydroxymethyldihydropteridinepyrophosphokinase [Legionella massiliensis]